MFVPRLYSRRLTALIFLFFIPALLTPERLKAQEDLIILDDWLVYRDAGNSLYNHLNHEAQALLALRRQRIAALASKDDWLAYQEKVRAGLARAAGDFPEKTPLNARVTGVIEKEDFRVEKIIYESRPGFLVSAALFVPARLEGRAPGILFCSGHSEDGFRSSAYQTMILNLVHKGFVVLAFDPYGQGERQDYLDASDHGVVVGGPTKQHSYAGAQLFLLGESMANYMIWDGIRGIDYLVSRPEVDARRIGVTGRSGGGTQTAYIAAIDERVAAAAPEAYITSFERLLMNRGPQDAEQNLFHGISAGINHGDLLIARAPRPTLMITTTRDIFSIQGARETFEEVKAAYGALGDARALQMVEDDAEHASTPMNREAMYRFFMNAFGVEGSSKDVLYPPLPAEALWVFEREGSSSGGNGKTAFDLLSERAASLVDSLNKNRTGASDFLMQIPGKAIDISGFEEVDDPQTVIFTGRYRRQNYYVEKHILQSNQTYPVPFLIFLPDSEGPHPVIVVLHPEGKQYGAKVDGMYETWVKKGFAVVAVDVLGTGELGPGAFRGDAYMGGTDLNSWFASILIDKSIIGLQLQDLARLHKYMLDRHDFDAARAVGIAFDESGSLLLHATAINGFFRGVALIRPLGSTSLLVSNRYYAPGFIPYSVAGALPAYDLPDLEAAFAPNWLLLVNPVDQKGLVMNEASINNQFEFVREVYKAEGHAERLSIVLSDDGDRLTSWLAKTLE